MPKSHVSARSANAAARNPTQFSEWANSVALDMDFRGQDQLPADLKKVLDDSQLIPKWITNPTAQEYKHCYHLFTEHISMLSNLQGTSLSPCDTSDTDLSRDVMSSLHPILSVVNHAFHLEDNVARPFEQDRRHTMDSLSSHVWENEGSKNFIHRVEYTLQLPKASPTIYTVKPDSTVFFLLEKLKIAFHGPLVKKACACAIDVPSSLAVLHWVTEYKRDGNESLSTNQVLEGLVSGLYQRRALGFKNHFLFGTIHHTRNTLDVIAATWVSPIAKPTDDAKTADKDQVDNMSGGQHESDSGKAGKQLPVGSSGGEKEAEPKSSTEAQMRPPGLSTPEKIVIYRLGTFGADSAVDMLRLYLLMRSTRKLALRYQREIDSFADERIRQLKETSQDIFDWPATPPPPAPPSSKPGSSSSKKRKFSPPATIHEGQQCLGEWESSDFSSTTESDSSLKLEADYEGATCSAGAALLPNVELASEAALDAKVMHYLATMVNGEYEPLDDGLAHS